MCLYKDQCKRISNWTKFPLESRGNPAAGNNSLPKTSFKLNWSNLDWNLAQQAWLSPRCLYLLEASIFAKGKLLALEQEGGGEKGCLDLGPMSRSYGESEAHERLVTVSGGEVPILKSRPYLDCLHEDMYLVTFSVPNSQPPSSCNKSSEV